MQDLDKPAMGKRIRQIRLGEGLRQWELARLLGTTQSAVHKYEHGVVPEPRRLIELARVGKTSIEWVLTGRHAENGSEEQQRVTSEVLRTASMLREIGEEERSTLEEALRISREAINVLKIGNGDRASSPNPAAVQASLCEHSEETLHLLESAWRIQRAVLHRLAAEAGKRLGTAADEERGAR